MNSAPELIRLKAAPRLGRAILDQLDKVGCRAIVTTHLGDLKTYAFSNDSAENGSLSSSTSRRYGPPTACSSASSA